MYRLAAAREPGRGSQPKQGGLALQGRHAWQAPRRPASLLLGGGDDPSRRARFTCTLEISLLSSSRALLISWLKSVRTSPMRSASNHDSPATATMTVTPSPMAA